MISGRSPAGVIPPKSQATIPRYPLDKKKSVCVALRHCSKDSSGTYLDPGKHKSRELARKERQQERGAQNPLVAVFSPVLSRPVLALGPLSRVRNRRMIRFFLLPCTLGNQQQPQESINMSLSILPSCESAGLGEGR